MHSALFPSAEDLDKAFMTLMLAKPDDLTVRSNILETNKKQGVAEEASPMIKPANNRFDNKQEAFKYAKEHGGSVFRSQYIDPNTGVKNISFVVKKKR